MRHKIGGQTGWEKERDAFKNGGGTYWVPDPSSSMTMQQLEAGYNKTVETRNGIEGRLGDYKSSNNQVPMMELIGLLEIKAGSYLMYRDALVEAQKLPTQTTPNNTNPSGTPNPVSDGGAGFNPLLLLAGAAGVMYFIVRSRQPANRKRKR